MAKGLQSHIFPLGGEGDAFARLRAGDGTKLFSSHVVNHHTGPFDSTRAFYRRSALPSSAGWKVGLRRHQCLGPVFLTTDRGGVDGNDHIDGSCRLCCSVSLDGRAIP